MIATDRLVLRSWRNDDLAAWLAINAEPEVAYWLGGALDPARSQAAFEAARRAIAADGHGMWAAERKADGAVIGSIGARRIPAEWEHPMAGEVELGWRLTRAAWGMGYASEGAAASLAWAFANLDRAEIVAFTAPSNARSQAVMRRIGMTRAPARDFDHPALDPGHPLRRHVVFMARKSPLPEGRGGARAEGVGGEG